MGTDQHAKWSICGEAHKQPLIIYRIHTWIPREMNSGVVSHAETDVLFVTLLPS